MSRWFTILIALTAQGMALMSPVCFVRCVAADGHQCVELAGQRCHCCDCPSHESLPQVCHVAICDEHRHVGDHGHDEEQEVPEGFQIQSEHCSCQHLPLESAPQTASKSLMSDALSRWHDAQLVPAILSGIGFQLRLEDASFRRSPLRPQESPHLAVMATVVLRL